MRVHKHTEHERTTGDELQSAAAPQGSPMGRGGSRSMAGWLREKRGRRVSCHESAERRPVSKAGCSEVDVLAARQVRQVLGRILQGGGRGGRKERAAGHLPCKETERPAAPVPHAPLCPAPSWPCQPPSWRRQRSMQRQSHNQSRAQPLLESQHPPSRPCRRGRCS